MPPTWQIMIYHHGSAPAPSEIMVTEMAKTAVARMKEIRAEYPKAAFHLDGSSNVSEDEANAVCQMATAAGLTLEREA